MTINVRPSRIVWLDYETGRGINHDGYTVAPVLKTRRKRPRLDDLLETALSQGADWIMLTGRIPATEPGRAHFLTGQTPGWAHGQHWLKGPIGRYAHELTGKKVEISLASAWFGQLSLNPPKARQAFNGVRHFLNRAEPQMTELRRTPATTGAAFWAYGLGKNFDPAPLDDYVARTIHGTAGQGRYETLVDGPNASGHSDCIPTMSAAETPQIDSLTLVDGRFMYAALCKELGTGPVHELRRDAAADLLRENPYARARYLVRFTVPDDWNHVGILGVQSEEDYSWYYPNRARATAETWADASEVHLAVKYGWQVEPLQALAFTEKTRPLDTFAQRLIRARDAAAATQGVEADVIKAVTNALRSVLIHGIGYLASGARDTMYQAASIDDVPAEYRHTLETIGDQLTYRAPAEMSRMQQSYYHPEIAAQVWGKSRARILDAPAANGFRAGALNTDPRTLLAIEGDALYTTTTPRWSLPTEYDGGDDGKVGRIRLKGTLQEKMPIPQTRDERETAKTAADAAGPAAAYTQANA
ncbi:hypothetical protein [Arthrobacter castelli]|uniref:hypothetical protein n=1 Tax=Arthrobacter castelli TaxID=271431 RepID=UPI00047E435C|nr:hypothetical protein [Arthrobacter castelli]